MFLLHALQLVEQQEAEAIYHPRFQRHRGLAVLQGFELVIEEIKIVLMGQRHEVHAGLMAQAVSLVIDAICHSTVAIEVFLHYLAVAILESLQDGIIGELRHIICCCHSHFFFKFLFLTICLKSHVLSP